MWSKFVMEPSSKFRGQVTWKAQLEIPGIGRALSDEIGLAGERGVCLTFLKTLFERTHTPFTPQR
jgi:hypothetical protein